MVIGANGRYKGLRFLPWPKGVKPTDKNEPKLTRLNFNPGEHLMIPNVNELNDKTSQFVTDYYFAPWLLYQFAADPNLQPLTDKAQERQTLAAFKSNVTDLAGRAEDRSKGARQAGPSEGDKPTPQLTSLRGALNNFMVNAVGVDRVLFALRRHAMVPCDARYVLCNTTRSLPLARAQLIRQLYRNFAAELSGMTCLSSSQRRRETT